MDIPYTEVDRIAKMVPTTLGIELEDALKEAPQLKSAINSDDKLKDLMAWRCGWKVWRGMLDARGRRGDFTGALTDLVPVYKTNRDEVTTQYDMNALERIGLLRWIFSG